MVIEKAKRLVEQTSANVVILLDSITRLGRAYNTVVPLIRQGADGGVDANCAVSVPIDSSALRATSRKAVRSPLSRLR